MCCTYSMIFKTLSSIFVLDLPQFPKCKNALQKIFILIVYGGKGGVVSTTITLD